MAIIPVPIPFPLYRDYYPSYYPSHSYRDSYQDERHHQEMMGKLDKLAEKDIGVSVVGADILQVARTAYESLSREVSDYEDRANALARRLIRIEARSERERKRKAKAKADSAREEYIQQNLSGRRWWERLSWLPSLYICRESLMADWEQIPIYRREGSSYDWEFEISRASRSREWVFIQHCPKPRFYDSFKDVKKVYESASLLPGATITIPVATIQVIGQIAAGLNAGAIEAD